jgi:hypothetical protein
VREGGIGERLLLLLYSLGLWEEERAGEGELGQEGAVQHSIVSFIKTRFWRVACAVWVSFSSPIFMLEFFCKCPCFAHIMIWCATSMLVTHYNDMRNYMHRDGSMSFGNECVNPV